MRLSLCSSFAPKAWPIRTVLPLEMPIMNETEKKTTGKIDDTAASAWTPMKRPRKMLLNVPDADCSRLLSMSGTRKTSIVCHSGREVVKMSKPRGAAAGDADSSAMRRIVRRSNAHLPRGSVGTRRGTRACVRLDKFMKVARLSKRRAEAHEDPRARTRNQGRQAP